jgi:hypothetical protein
MPNIQPTTSLTCLSFLYEQSSILKGMGDVNFTDQKLLASQEKVIKFVVDLFKAKVKQDHMDQVPVQESAPLGVVQGVSGNESGVAMAAANDVGNEEDDEMFMMGLIQAGATLAAIPEGTTLEVMMDDLKKGIQQEFLSYVAYCKKIDWKEVLAKHGTEKYKKLLREKAVIDHKMNVNPRYTRTLFDVIGWWTDTGSKLFPKIAVAALIILAKATHNGYQERVFSIGTFLDTKQQKRREERHYEMDVLQRINRELMQEQQDWGERDETEAHNDKELMEGFFKMTEAVQEQQASLAPEAKVDDVSVSVPTEDDEVSVDAAVSDDDNNGEQDQQVPYTDIAGSDDESMSD